VKKNQLKRVNKSEIVRTSQTDTLKFTSGIHAIFQDSKGNYWFESHKEGVSYYDGKQNISTEYDGLLDNQIRSIEEDKTERSGLQ
jgi:ligand-binding sensor domain-containing protein